MTEKRTKKDEAAEATERVMDAIVTQALAPSQKVSENILSDMFGFSRTLARNLIERLTAKHFLTPLSPRVTVVAPLTLLEIKQNFTLRKVLLPATFSLAAANLDYDKLKVLNRKIQKMQPVRDDATALEVLKKNKELNLTLCAQAGYPLMLDWAQQLEDTAMRIYWLYVKTRGHFPYSSDQQGMILDVMKSDESSKIQAAILSTLSQTEERILNAIFTHEQFYNQDLTV
ncbi:GntR family transcriptional regulator [Parahaliea mediterranea]|uniref:GntR family transcriptional regulator n=1 Tax=Parahaliea mediterranea TaxID=651086 RepID=A0A939INH3_9GAMM|nr:GntR family transcriptional regulator [Parahaliea mediterranea]MBN7798123.1 GntR family transcriptional regulator [Parahaliea mediterranea]